LERQAGIHRIVNEDDVPLLDRDCQVLFQHDAVAVAVAVDRDNVELQGS